MHASVWAPHPEPSATRSLIAQRKQSSPHETVRADRTDSLDASVPELHFGGGPANRRGWCE
jgi:hypothetical protein